MNKLRIIGFFACLAVAAMLFSGCAQSQKVGPMKDMEFSVGGELPGNFWDEMSKTTSKGPVQWTSNNFFWLLPFQLYHSELVAVPDSKDVLGKRLEWNDLGFIFLTLPVRAMYIRTYYEEGKVEPVGKQGVAGWLLHVWSVNEGKTDPNMTFKAKGSPLFFSKTRIKEENVFDLGGWQSIWSFGPAHFGAKFTPKQDSEMTEIYATTPLLLGGFLGSVLWLDIKVRQGDENYFTAHGPLMGALGYISTSAPMMEKTEDADGKPIVRAVGRSKGHSLLASILWSDYVQRDVQNNIRSSRAGLLWTAFGWGSKDDKSGPRFLWIPIYLF